MDSLDDLDSALFGKSFESKDSKVSTVVEVKKKVGFEEFDINVPLDGLNLSDDEDSQESSIENPIDISKNSKLATLFGIKTKNQSENYDIAIKKTLPTKDTEEKSIEQKSVLQESNVLGTSNDSLADSKLGDSFQKDSKKMKPLFDDDDDITTNLLGKSKIPSNNQTKKSMFMEDLFGSRPKSGLTKDTNSKKSILSFDAPPPTRASTGESLAGLITDNTKKPSTSSGYSLSVPKESRRGRRTSTVPNDPLGLLSSSDLLFDDPFNIDDKQIEDKTAVTTDATQKSTNIDRLPEWLVGPKLSKDSKQQEVEKFQAEDLSSAKSKESLNKSSIDLASTIPVESAEQSALGSKLLSLELEQQTALMGMQQQEHELRTATVLTRQNDHLAGLLKSQRARLLDQERQFDGLIARQMERQAAFEAQMRAQQERIDAYIKTLAAQPTTLPLAQPHSDISMATGAKETETNEKTESESLLQKLQLEKLYLENTLESLREKHEKEISILDESYRKQVAFLEEAMVQMEKRMQDDAECLEADYKSKIQKLRDEISENHKHHLEEKKILKEENAKLLEELREQHSQSLAVLQKEHAESIERITSTKQSERRAIEIMNAETTNVRDVLENSRTIVQRLEELHGKVEAREVSAAESCGSWLAVHEKSVQHLKELLEKQKDEFAEERRRLNETIRSLEANAVALTQEFRVQSHNFREAEEGLKSREEALLREREIFIEQTNWERERLQAMRESWTKEHDQQLEWLAQERQNLAAEKGKLQIFNRLKIGVDESSKAELEATMRAAQDAAASANQERLRWQEKINELEIQQNILRDKESRLVGKAKELQEFTQSAISKRDEGLRALKEARFIEERYREKFNQLQAQQEALARREARLAAEKLELARQRLEIRANDEQPEKDTGDNELRRDFEGKDSSRCGYSDAPTASNYTARFKDIVDPRLVLLKWELNDKSEISRGFPVTFSH